MKTNDGAWAALTPDATPGVSFVTNAPLEASAHPRCLSDAGFSAAVVLNTGIDYVPICVEIKFYGAFVLNRRVVLHAIDATPARWRGDAGSSPLDRARTAASSPRNDLVKCTRRTG